MEKWFGERVSNKAKNSVKFSISAGQQLSKWFYIKDQKLEKNKKQKQG